MNWHYPKIPEPEFKRCYCGLNWRSIKNELPPQDGTPFLGYDPNIEESGKIYVLVYVPARKYPEGQYYNLSHDSYYREASGEGYFVWEPTHWIPLPQPPEES